VESHKKKSWGKVCRKKERQVLRGCLNRTLGAQVTTGKKAGTSEIRTPASQSQERRFQGKKKRSVPQTKVQNVGDKKGKILLQTKNRTSEGNVGVTHRTGGGGETARPEKHQWGRRERTKYGKRKIKKITIQPNRNT